MSKQPMEITSVDIYKYNIPWTEAVRVPLGFIDASENVLVRITTNSGIYGFGEASPFAPITGGTQATNFEAAKVLAKLIKGKNALNIESNMAAINMAFAGQPSIRSAFDMALHDILGKNANLPLYQVLGGENRQIRTDKTIGIKETIEQTLASAEEILSSGFDSIKMKVGRSSLQDVTHVKAVREFAGPDIHLKIDSNQGWDYPSAVANLLAMEPLNLQYSEQPLAAWDYDNLKRLRDKVKIPICADESVFDHHDAFKLAAMDAVDYFNIKLGKAGGIHTGLKINAIAEASGKKCMIGCFGESRLALSAAAHLALARPNISFIDLDSTFYMKADPVEGGVIYDKKIGGLITIPETPGLGVEINNDFLSDLVQVQI